MDVRAPLTSLSPTLDMRILTAMVAAEASFTSGDLARVTGASRSGVSLALERLARAGVVDVQTYGRTNAYTLNRDHLLTEALLLAADAGTTLNRRTAELIDSWRIQPTYAALFGSTARRDGDDQSDIDVLIVRPDGTDPDDLTWSRQLAELQEGVRRWTGNACELLVLSQAQWSDAQASDARIATEIHRDGIPLFPRRAVA